LSGTSLALTAAVSSVASLDVSGYDYYDGTSMSAPHVSGAAALVWSKYPTATNKQVRQALTESAEDLGAAGRDNSFGWGLVRANNAITRLGQIVGGGGGGDTTPPVISNVSTATSKGRAGAQGSFTVSFTTNEPATSVVSIPELSSKTTSLGTSHTVTFQGVKGATYNGTITATDAAGNTSAPVSFTRNN
jgi:serine protease